jgi:hypothetical protein
VCFGKVETVLMVEWWIFDDFKVGNLRYGKIFDVIKAWRTLLGKQTQRKSFKRHKGALKEGKKLSKKGKRAFEEGTELLRRRKSFQKDRMELLKRETSFWKGIKIYFV